MKNREFKNRLKSSLDTTDLFDCKLGDTVRIHKDNSYIDYIIKDDEYDEGCLILERVDDDTEIWIDAYSVDELMQGLIISYLEGKCDGISLTSKL